MRIVRRPQAQADIDEIWSYIAVRDLQAADRTAERISRSTDRLLHFPRSGRTHFDIRNGLRGVSATPYTIFYQLVDDRIEILRVLHGARDIDVAGFAP